MIDWLEQRIGWLAIPHLSAVLIVGQLMSLILWQGNPAIVLNWLLEPNEVLQNGEWWRLILFVFIAPADLLIGLFHLLCAWVVLRPLEIYWGPFRFNLYILISVVSTIAYSLYSGQVGTNVWIGTSTLLAFCYLFPDVEFRLFLLIPIKAKWIGFMTWVGHLLAFSSGGWPSRIFILCGLLNFLIYFGWDLWKSLWKTASHTQRAAKFARGSRISHRCCVCGITENDDPQIEFRYCSKCADQREFCELHLRSHEHTQPGNSSVREDAPTSVT